MPPLPKPADSASQVIQKLIERLVPGGESIYLDVEPVVGALENECYGNVDIAIKNAGGTIQYGWKLWETLPNVMAEAEFHAVWVDKNGEMHEVSPEPLPGMSRILFLPDPNRTYSGHQIDNVRIPLQEDNLIEEFIANSEQHFEVMNRGELVGIHGEIPMTGEIRNSLLNQQISLMKVLRKYFS